MSVLTLTIAQAQTGPSGLMSFLPLVLRRPGADAAQVPLLPFFFPALFELKRRTPPKSNLQCLRRLLAEIRDHVKSLFAIAEGAAILAKLQLRKR